MILDDLGNLLKILEELATLIDQLLILEFCFKCLVFGLESDLFGLAFCLFAFEFQVPLFEDCQLLAHVSVKFVLFPDLFLLFQLQLFNFSFEFKNLQSQRIIGLKQLRSLLLEVVLKSEGLLQFLLSLLVLRIGLVQFYIHVYVFHVEFFHLLTKHCVKLFGFATSGLKERLFRPGFVRIIVADS